MPSPIAHSAMAVIIAPLLLRKLPPGTSAVKKLTVAGGILFATVAADLDIPLGFATGVNGFSVHGEFTHSIVIALIVATIFALWIRCIAPVNSGRAWAVGMLAYGSHLFLDAINHGRGIMLLWPFTNERYASPVRIFYGVRHSDLSDWSHHLIMLATELIFVLVVLIAARPMYVRNSQTDLIPP